MKNIIEIAGAKNYMAMIKNRIARVVSWTFLFSTILISCSKSSGSNNSTSPAPGTVSIVNMPFTPASITVTPGTTVTWNNIDNMISGSQIAYELGF